MAYIFLYNLESKLLQIMVRSVLRENRAVALKIGSAGKESDNM
jgi:hypothetical protein